MNDNLHQYSYKGAFLDSLGRDYYVIGTASDIQVNKQTLKSPTTRGESIERSDFQMNVVLTKVIVCKLLIAAKIESTLTRQY